MSTIPFKQLKNGVPMPQIGLGVWQASDDEAQSAVEIALNAGYRLIDTAALYQNEAGVGRAITASGVPREELFITTKLWNNDQGYEQTLKAFDVSLKKLELDYIDLYLIHWPMPKQDTYLETWKAFEKLYTDKKVRAIGVSNFHIPHLEKLLAKCEIAPAINQIELHPDFQQKEIRQYCHAHDIQVESWSPLGGSQNGILSDAAISAIAQKHKKSPAQVVIRWHIQNDLVVIPKSVHAERIRENFDVFGFTLDQEDLDAIGLLDANNRVGPNPDRMNNH